MFVVILLILIIIIMISKSNVVENLVVVGDEKNKVVGRGKQNETINYRGTYTNFNGRMAIDDQYFYDKLFDDVVYYENDYDYDTGKLITTGWDKCKTNCQGNCVEYFLSGDSYCFPY